MKRTVEIIIRDEDGRVIYGQTVKVELHGDGPVWVAKGDNGRTARHEDSHIAAIQLASPSAAAEV